MVQVQSENECVLGGATSEALPLPGLGPFKLPPLPRSFCHSPSAPPHCLHLSISALPPPPLPAAPSRTHTSAPARGPDSSFRDPVPATANMSSEKSGKKEIPIAPTAPPSSPLSPPACPDPFFDPLWGVVRLSPIPLPGTQTPTPSSSCKLILLFLSLGQSAMSTTRGGGRLRRRGRHSQVLQGHHPWE